MWMKNILAAAFVIMTVSSCNTKCVTCSAYYAYNDTILADKTESVRSCNKTDINAYEQGKNYTNANDTAVVFKCQ